MELTVLGRYGTMPAQNGCCSGYLLSSDNIKILIDCGNGVLSRLQQFCCPEDLDCIVISHLHDDHCGDLRILKYALETKHAFKKIEEPLDIFIPDTPCKIIEDLNEPEVFKFNFIHEDKKELVKGIKLYFSRMEHTIKSFAVLVEDGSGRIVYSGDTKYNKKLVKFAEGADLFLCESTFAVRDEKSAMTPHMSAYEAGKIASEAGVKKLLLTHFWYQESPEDCLDKARDNIENVYYVEELKSYLTGACTF